MTRKFIDSEGKEVTFNNYITCKREITCGKYGKGYSYITFLVTPDNIDYLIAEGYLKEVVPKKPNKVSKATKQDILNTLELLKKQISEYEC